MNSLFYIYIAFTTAIGAVGAAPVSQEPSPALDADAANAIVAWGPLKSDHIIHTDKGNNIITWGVPRDLDTDATNPIVAWGLPSE
ncbi:hypothetical protein PWT90_08529 [Aphanocladium album]|nr:hypothetical protein PWT90_08529 [Aphanocladium album]